MKKNTIVIIGLVGFFFALSGCNIKQTSYMQKYANGMESKQVTVLKTTIEYIDNFIASGGGKDIPTAWYNKAQLLYKLGRMDEAEQALKASESSMKDFHLATFYMITGRNAEADILIQNLCHTYAEQLSLGDSQRVQAVKSLQVMYIVSDMEFSDFLEMSNIKGDTLTSEELAQIENKQAVRSELIGQLWPK
jgi:hypothetical protein